ncbi:uncharacterized protein Dwil_GK27358 [Drosophila willistoni]|uniref:Uncharacterized protein n=1 Tax=Drosophila willistoni TaxID=7260 RepID=A0A0Q9WWH1_DROWI|nr:uncharacterized protein LOC26529360 [Drosophila willistoni]KRF99784.1 uncharacterized protein Dwil_GK27358 [Drosophila willistoni]
MATSAKSTCICLIILLILLVVFSSIGLYFTFTKEKKMVLESCHNMGGSCLEFNHCNNAYQSRVITRCILARKVCCMKTEQVTKSLD